ncbi:hypothetical protein GCK32_018875 [Trichostrongylus colubriformis]|uniref:Uncharacterized protein n=1 Tax=Trichostrongylus colubriformis TaxID=6319 RepID=A0AAN8FNM3_TRICO
MAPQSKASLSSDFLDIYHSSPQWNGTNGFYDVRTPVGKVLAGITNCCEPMEQCELRFKDIPEKHFKKLIRESELHIKDTDCTQSYKMEIKDGKPIYLFNIERQEDATRIYGMINRGTKGKPYWRESNPDEFLYFLETCNGTATMPDDVSRRFVGFLSCRKTTQRNRALRHYSRSPKGLIEKIKDMQKY